MKKIDGQARTIRELLKGAKYSIDYYQREFKWQTKQALELLNDLAAAFLDDHDPSHAREEVASYGHYFLGSIIVSVKNTQKFVIDGQQRLTTLTLLLIYLHNLSRERKDVTPIEELSFSEKYSKKSFNLDVEERTPCMEALFNQQPYDPVDRPESVRNIVGRYQDIAEHFPEGLTEAALPYFVDWLIENVHLVEITAYSDEDAYTIFETMNDRGLSLTPTDMLKGYLLANITDDQNKLAASKTWKSRVGALVSHPRAQEGGEARRLRAPRYRVPPLGSRARRRHRSEKERRFRRVHRVRSSACCSRPARSRVAASSLGSPSSSERSGWVP